MDRVSSILPHFISGPVASRIQQLTSGKIHTTYRIGFGDQEYILQKLNTRVFPDPDALEHNYDLLYRHLRKKDHLDILPVIIAPKDGGIFYKEGSEYWRMFQYHPDTVSYEAIRQPGLAEKAAFQFGTLIRLLADLEPEQFKVSIPGFHDLELRFREMQEAAEHSSTERMGKAKGVIRSIAEHQDILDEFMSLRSAKLLPIRLVHHDTKISNILFDKNTGQPARIIDLDTLMPGILLSDFGDMIRSFACSIQEDQAVTKQVLLDPLVFSATVKGFLTAVREIVQSVEKEKLLFGAKMMIYMQAIRYLTDYLKGDVYYQTGYPQQNLQRCKNQLALLGSLIKQEQDLELIVS